VRSDAKASTAGSTQRQAPGFGAVLGGALAVRHASLASKGTGAPSARRLLASLCGLIAAVAVLCAAAAPASAAAPTIAATWSDEVVFSDATLRAEIDPEGEATTYRFEYGPSVAYGSQTPELAVGSDSSLHKVTRLLQGLQPNTTYHYRVVANNGGGVEEGPDRTFTTFAPFAPDTSCANQAFRFGASANLPDCRAYEMVSPVDKGGRGIVAGLNEATGDGRAAFDQAATAGDSITYTSASSFGDQMSNRNANQYLSSRGAAGWSTRGISPPRGKTVLTFQNGLNTWSFDTPFRWISEDLSTAWIKDHNKPPLTPDAFAGTVNLYRADIATGTYHEPVITSEPLTWNTGPEGETLGIDSSSLAFKGRSQDGSHAIFEAAVQLTPDALASSKIKQIYERSDGVLRLVSVLPGGEANPGYSWVGSAGEAQGENVREKAFVERAVSDDGSRIFWTDNGPLGDGGGRGRIYVRIDGTTTIAVSESVAAEPAQFWTASTDGSKAVFSFKPGGVVDELYEFNVDTETPTFIASEVTAVPGASEDLSRIYFVSREALDGVATAGEENLYLRQNGTIHFVATVAEGDVVASGGVTMPTLGGRSRFFEAAVPANLGVRVTPDGGHLAFMSSRSLTGYDNTDAVSGEAVTEVFLYDAVADELTCVSCNPSGARPHGARTRTPFTIGPPEVQSSSWWTAAWIPPWERELNASQVLSDDGSRVFFNAIDALVPQDTNGHQDVYQWEAQGTGTCQEAGGCVSLISTGKSPSFSEFIDASADGRDVFIRTESNIDPSDPGLMDIYDAREGGGYPPPPPPPPPCVGDGCQGVPAAPNDPTPASAGFKGAGDPAPRKARRSCKAARKRASKLSPKAKRKAAKRCRRANRRAGR
jgi:hypothetical protein